MGNSKTALQLFSVILFSGLVNGHFVRPRGQQDDIVPLIVGGVEAVPHEFPWMVSIQRTSHSCGGSILTPEWILTAAHCVQSDPSTYRIIAGEHNFTAIEGSEQQSVVDEIIVHESYDDQFLENDIALMRLRTPFQMNSKVQPAPLPLPDFDAKGLLVVAGWGRLSWQGPLPDVLMKVDVPFIDLEVCRAVYPEDLNPVFDHNICAGYLGGLQDSCNGDSGGPLMCRVSENGTDSLNVCGLVSWGGLGDGSCAAPYEPGVYTAVAPFYNWIMQNIRLHSHK